MEFSHITNREVARILNLPVILERVPVKKVDAAGVAQVKRTVAQEPSLVGSRALVGSMGNAPGSSWVLPILNALHVGELFWAFIYTLFICIFMIKKDYKLIIWGKSAKLVKFMPGYKIS